MLLFLPGRGFVFIQQPECRMKVNISLEDLFGEKTREMRERDKAFCPNQSGSPGSRQTWTPLC